MVAPHTGRLSAIAGASFIGALVEAGFLVVVTQTALAVTSDDRSIEVAGRSLGVSAAVAWAGALIATRAALAIYGVFASAQLALTVGTQLRTRLADAFIRASWATQQGEPTGRLQQLVSGFAMSAIGVLRSFSTALTSMLSLTALIAVALVVNPLATTVVVGALLVLGAVLSPLRRMIRSRSEEAAEVSMRFATGISEYGALGLEMQTFGVRAQFSERIAVMVAEEARAARRAEVLRQSISPIYTTLGYLALLGGLAAAAAVGAQQLSSVGAVMLVMLRSLTYGQAFQVSMANLISAIPFMEIVDETLHRFEGDQAPGGDELVERVGTIELDSVSFAYPGGAEVLEDLSFQVSPGEHVGVVGPSGSGKSTLVQLLLGLREPTKGEVRVGGVDLTEVDRTTWNPLVAFVAQDAQLFSGTIAENIAFFREKIGPDRIREAATDARLLEEIESMPDGFDTQVGERGGRLSGGQRQRVSIARALAGRPQLLILDEPTSALDVKSEVAIRQTLADLRGTVTVVVIAHRLSTLERCDKVMVIQAGRLLAMAAPNELSAHSEFYREALELSRIE